MERRGPFQSIRRRLDAIRIEPGLAILALALLIPALALTAHAVIQFAQGRTPPPQTLTDVLERELLASRVAFFVLMMVVWPTLLVICARFLDLRFPRPERVLALAGMAMGASACLVASLPWPGPALALLPPLVLPLAVLPHVLDLHWWRVARFWLVQLVLILPLALGTIWCVESLLAGAPLNPAREFRPIAALARREPLPPVTLFPLPRGTTFPNLHWEPGPSRWLDRRANRVWVEAVNPVRKGAWSLSVRSADQRRAYLSTRSMVPGHRSVTFVPRSSSAYRISLDPAGEPGDVVLVHSLLPMTPG